MTHPRGFFMTDGGTVNEALPWELFLFFLFPQKSER